MSNILKVTTPVTGYDNTSQVRTNPVKNTDPSVQGQVNPARVMRPDARSDAASQEQNAGLKFQYESNYGSFVSQMKDSPVLTEQFAKIFFSGLGTAAEAGIGEEFAAKIGEFLNMIQVAPQDMAKLVKSQNHASIRYGGAFFSLLRKAMEGGTSLEQKAGILEFMKRYTDMAETPHMLENIGQTLKNIKSQMFQQGRQELEALESQLTYKPEAGSAKMKENLEILRGKILPFLNLYISRTHERGGMRDLTALLASCTARCENGQPGRVTEAFERLIKYPVMQRYFQGFETSSLLFALSNTEFEKASREQHWMKNLGRLIEDGMAGAGGVEQRAVFKNIMQSILLNESVYMPVLHMMLPMQVEGRLMFAEMWVDPDAGGGSRKQEEDKRTIQCLIKFDIKDVGFFDLYFIYQDGTIRMQLNCPEKLREKTRKITEDMSRIMGENGIRAEELYVEPGQKSIPISDVFPKIFERKNAVNVSI